MQAVDINVLKQLPASAIAAAAIGINGEEMWEYHIKPLFELASQANPNKTSEEIQTDIDNMLSAFGIDVGLQDLISGLNGTAFMCITPSVPFPAASIGIPRNENVDAFVTALLISRFNIIAPAEGAIESIPFMPMVPPIQLALSKTHWFISTDRALTQQFLNGQSSGWDQSDAGAMVLKKAEENAFFLGSVDVKQITAIGQSFMGLAAMTAKGDDIKHVQAAVILLQRLNQMAEPAWAWAGQEGTDYKIEAFSLTGSIPMIIAPGAIAGKVQQDRRAQRRARRMQQQEQQRALEAEKAPDSVDDL